MSKVEVIFICGDETPYVGYDFPINFKVAPRVNDYVRVSADVESHYESLNLPLELQVNKVVWSETGVEGNQVATCYLYTPLKYQTP